MNKQRKFTLISSLVGSLSIFLPWAHVPLLGAINGTVGNMGWVALFLFSIVSLFSLTGDRSKTFGSFKFWTSSIIGLFILIFGIIKSFELSSISSLVTLGIGAYMVILSGLSILVSLNLFKNKGENLWYNNIPILVVLTLFVFPLGLIGIYLRWRHNKNKN
jgi:hypothetical protein